MIEWNFTATEARLLYGLIASFVVPFVVSLLKRSDWQPRTKVMLAMVVAVAAGFLSEFAAGTLDGPISAIVAGVAIFTAAQAHFATWFQALGAEDRLMEDRAVADRLSMLQ